jgi:hypothetical protein
MGGRTPERREDEQVERALQGVGLFLSSKHA